jgi:hypothetical protein
MDKKEKARIFEEFIKNYGFYRLKLFEDSFIYRNFYAKTKLIHENCLFEIMPNEFTLFLQFHKKFSVEVSFEKNGKYFNVFYNKNIIKFSIIIYKASGKHVGYNQLIELFETLQ